MGIFDSLKRWEYPTFVKGQDVDQYLETMERTRRHNQAVINRWEKIALSTIVVAVIVAVIL